MPAARPRSESLFPIPGNHFFLSRIHQYQAGDFFAIHSGEDSHVWPTDRMSDEDIRRLQVRVAESRVEFARDVFTVTWSGCFSGKAATLISKSPTRFKPATS